MRRGEPTAELIRPSRCGGDADNIAPSAKGVVASGTVLGGGEAVTAELEVVVDAGVNGQKALGMAG